MRHLYECQVRWADMDLLGHINNVSYLDYLQEARIALFAQFRDSPHAGLAGELLEGIVVVRHEVQFVAPMTYRRHPVSVETWVSEVRAASVTMSYEVFSERDGQRTVYLRANSVLAPFLLGEERPRRLNGEERAFLERYRDEPVSRSGVIPAAPDQAPIPFALHTRFSDIDAYGHVNNVTYFAYFQEARIQYLMTLARPEDDPWQGWVVAATDVEYRRPIRYRLAAYDVVTWVESVGNSSTRLCAEIRDGQEVLARSSVVMVTFDKDTQRAAPMPAHQRERLLEAARSAGVSPGRAG